jgi:predicted RNA binding protein YcfA (HicA-like mRNA interferase family)
MVLDAKKTLKNLRKKGFMVVDGDHKFLEFYHNDKLVLHTKISHGEKDLNDFLIAQMSKQCKISKLDFFNLASCPLSQKAYVEILRSQSELIDD